MRTSETIADLATALSLTQASMKGALKDSTNPHFKSKYADLSSVWDACREPMTKHGLSVVQGAEATEHGILVTTRLMHKTGQWIESSLGMTPINNTPQAVGSCLTYCRRYGLSAILGVAPEDDDGNEGSQQSQGYHRQEERRESPKAAPAPTTSNTITPTATTAPPSTSNLSEQQLADSYTHLADLMGADFAKATWALYPKKADASERFTTMQKTNAAVAHIEEVMGQGASKFIGAILSSKSWPDKKDPDTIRAIIAQFIKTVDTGETTSAAVIASAAAAGDEPPF